jgi:hypothetical protein
LNHSIPVEGSPFSLGSPVSLREYNSFSEKPLGKKCVAKLRISLAEEEKCTAACWAMFETLVSKRDFSKKSSASSGLLSRIRA